MAIEIQDGFEISTNKPVDSRYVFDTIAERNALDTLLIYEGLVTYVKEDKTAYVFSSNDPYDLGAWSELGSGGGAGGGSLTFSPLSDYSTYTPAMEVINNGAKGLLMDAPNVGVVTSFIVPANYDRARHDLFVNVPFVCQKGALACSFVADYTHKGNGNDNSTSHSENVDVSTLEFPDPVGTYRMVKIPITLFTVLANGLVVLRLRARPSTLLWDAEYIILRDGAFISLEKK